MNTIQNVDPEIAALIKNETHRQATTLMMIPSENIVSKAVEEAVGSVLGNKYAEGYPFKRYYQGQEFVDQIEQLAIDRAKELFDVAHVNVQPYSGSPANTAIYWALLEPGDTITGLTLSHGGHLTHGHPKVTFSGTQFNSVPYQVEKDGWIDYVKLAKHVKKHKPKLIVAGTTAYPRILEFDRFAEIADSVGAYLLADISHISGLVASNQHPSPAPYADVIMTTTHKTLRAARGAMIMVTHKGIKKDEKLGDKIDKAVFPALQGGPHMNNIAGIAVGLKEALNKEFQTYGQQIVDNADALATQLIEQELELVTNGTDNHLMVIDVRNTGYTGKEAAVLLEKAGIVVNANTIPYDPNPPYKPSGIRLGTPALTTIGMKQKEMKIVGTLIAEVLQKKRSTEDAYDVVQQLIRQF